MDNKEAKKNLQDLKESLEKVLGDDGLKEEAQEHAKAAKQGAKTLLERIKEFPVVEKISSLGTAGTVAVSTAAVTQADLAVNYTEIVVAQVAEDVWEGVIEPPGFIDAFVDFDSLHTWGQQVIAEKVAEVSELQPTSAPSAELSDTKPEASVSSQDAPPSQTLKPSNTDKSSESEKQQNQEPKTDKSSNENNEETESEPQEEPKEEIKQSTPSKESKTKDLPIVNTPIDNFDDDIKPHSSVRNVSPTN